jgi:hypothetical protein
MNDFDGTAVVHDARIEGDRYFRCRLKRYDFHGILLLFADAWTSEIKKRAERGGYAPPGGGSPVADCQVVLAALIHG